MNLREQLEKEITEKVMIKLAQHKVELGVADKALKTFDLFRDKQLQNAYDLKTQVEDLIKKYNKKVDDTTRKFREIEKGEYLAAYTKINDMARELDVAPNEVPQLKELMRKYHMNGEYVRDLKKIIVSE